MNYKNFSRMRSNKTQLRVLVDYMSTNKQFANGVLEPGPVGSRRAEAQWLKLKEILKNYGPDRSVKQWKQTWKDLKKNARIENAFSAQATGNTLDAPIVSEIAKKVLDTIEHDSSTAADFYCWEYPDDVIELLIEKVKLCTCLWDTSQLAYRDTKEKDLAWRQIASECGMADGKEAESLWKKLRHNYKSILRYRKTATGQAEHKLEPWKYETQMEFLLPLIFNRVVSPTHLNDSHTTVCDTPNVSDNKSNNRNKEVSSTPLSVPVKSDRRKLKKLAVEAVKSQLRRQRREKQLAQSDDLRRIEFGVAVPHDSLSNLFTSLLQKTRVLPKSLQLRVQREIFDSVARAEEEAMSTSHEDTGANDSNRTAYDPLLVANLSPTGFSTPDDGSNEEDGSEEESEGS